MINVIESLFVPAVIILLGGYFLIKTKAFFILKPKSFIFALKRGGASAKTLSLALAGTLGVGNIVGVAGAVSLGGAGALFWMIISSFFAMMLKYAETSLAIKNSISDAGGRHGGAMYYLSSKYLSALFSAVCIITAFSLGGALQTKAAGEFTYALTGIPQIAVTAVMGILCLVVIIGGKRRIFDITAAIVPFMSILYALMCLAVIIANFASLPLVFREIIESAFDFRSILTGGGFAALRYGVIRGLISNEAGCGTSPIAHSANENVASKSAGCLGIVEVLVDTPILCTLTGISILIVPGCRDGDIKSILRCFSSLFGNFSSYLLTISIILFAFATLVCWSFYGCEAVHYLVKYGMKNNIAQECGEKAECSPGGKRDKSETVFMVAFCVISSLSGIFNGTIFWFTTDLCVALMTIINSLALLRRRHEILSDY